MSCVKDTPFKTSRKVVEMVTFIVEYHNWLLYITKNDIIL